MPEIRSRPSRRGAGIVAAAVAAAAVLTLIVLTGGASSGFVPLLGFPLILAAAWRDWRVLLASGLFLSAAWWVIASSSSSSPGPSLKLVLQAVALAGMGLTAAAAVRLLAPPSDEETVTASEREELVGLAFTDPMTGLFNFRKFRSTLEDELKRAARYGRSLSLIIIDLDGFKSVNDQYGHPAGDRVLATLAATIRMSVRETDVPARYGGEEFVVVCPETDQREAMMVAERIRSALEAIPIEATPGEFCSITCSAGVATFPDHARDEVGLIEASDEALYRAKTSGKNRVHGPAPARSLS